MQFFYSFMAVPEVFEITVFLVAVAAGVFGSLLGLGGGVILVPVLTLFLGVNIRYAVGASIVSVIATSSGAAATYVRDRITNMRVALLLEMATTFGALCGAALAIRIPVQILYVVFSMTLLYSAFAMFRGRHKIDSVQQSPDPWAKFFKLDSSYPDFEKKKEIFYSVRRVPLGFFLMLGAGLISALLGIGSGALKVPAMDRAMGLPMKVSSATSNFMIGVTAAASAGAYYMHGDIVPMLAAPVALGVFLGSLVGSKIMVRLPASRLRGLFVIVLILLALQMGWKAL